MCGINESDLTFGMSSGDIKIIAILKVNGKIVIEDITTFSAEKESTGISEGLIRGFIKFFQRHLSEKAVNVGEYIEFYMNKLRPRRLQKTASGVNV